MNNVEEEKVFKPCQRDQHDICAKVDVFDPTSVCVCPCHTPKVKRSCNRHGDCDVAASEYREKYGKDPGVNFHCHDEDCEDCFGK